MATIKLTLYNLPNESSMELDNGKTTGNYKFSVLLDGGTTTEYTYQFSLTEIDMVKKMYQPVEIIANIHIALYNDPNSTADDNLKWVAVSRSDIEKLFKHRKAKLEADGDEIGGDFYVHEVIPEYNKDTMYVKLKIYSLDKMLTLRKTCRSFVGKQLGEILATELKNYQYPYESKNLGDDTSQTGADTQKGIHKMFSTANMKVLKFKGKTEGYVYDETGSIVQENGKNKTEIIQVEHIFPYLVQYNESLYDMLSRTANRWGEFLYYQDGKIRFGYDSAADTKEKAKSVGNYTKITFPNTDTDDDLTKNDTKGHYDHQAAYDKTVDDSPVPTSPYIVKGELFQWNGAFDKFLLKKFAQFLNHGKNLNSFFFDTVVDDAVSASQAASSTAAYNSLQDDIYFSSSRQNKESIEKYGDYTFVKYDDKTEEKQAFNEFTEISSEYNEGKYRDILAKELKASNNMVVIDYDTTWPGLKLGDIINVNNERFIVVDISIKTEAGKQLIKVTGIGRQSETDIFYPAVLPTGHVRYSGPQKAKIMDADDPTLKNRVRVAFPWQGDEKGDVSGVDVAEATPWLVFAAKGDGKSSTGRHNKGTDVLVGFIDNNIERPYVMGAIQDKVPYDTTIDVDFDTPGGHHMRLSDGCGTGIINFVTSALSPMMSTIFEFAPPSAIIGGIEKFVDLPEFSAGKRLEGGFTLSDYYGIYRISGSTDQRNITISSPWGDVKLNAFTGITIAAPNGDVKISGKNVTIEAGNNLKLVSGTNVGYKIFQDRKFKDSSWKPRLEAIGLTAAGAVAKRLLEKFQILDFTFIRCMIESVMRPVEGALTVKSNRYLKLVSGKNVCEYPTLAFKDAKERNEKLDNPELAKAAKALGIPNLNQSVALTFKLIPVVVAMLQHRYINLYNDCVNKKKQFDTSISQLKVASNDSKQNPCKTFDDLKNDFWSDDFTLKFDETKMGFNDELVGTAQDKVDDKFANIKDFVIRMRTQLRSDIVDYATNLRNAIVELLKLDLLQSDIDALFTNFNDKPEDAEKKLLNAVCRENNQDLFIYAPPTKEKGKNFSVLLKSGFTDAQQKFLLRKFALNLLDEFDLIDSRVANLGEILPSKPTITDPTATGKGNIMHYNTWNEFVNSLNGLPIAQIAEKQKGMLASFGADMVDSLLSATGVYDFACDFARLSLEQQAWNEGMDGGILLGANKQTYMLGEGDNPNFKVVNKRSPRTDHDRTKAFLDDLKDVLRKY